MHFHTITSRIRNETGQAVIEFALVLPLLVAVLLLIVGFARVFNEYNDLNQMAADGARFAAVGNFPGASALLANGDTPLSRAPNVQITGPTYSGGSCTVGGTVTVQATAQAKLIPFLPYVNAVLPNLTGTAQMRVEQCPS